MVQAEQQVMKMIECTENDSTAQKKTVQRMLG